MKRRPLTAAEIATARRLWAAGEPRDAIAAALGISIDTFRARLRDQLAGLPKRDHGKNSTRRGIDPSPREIAAATARIRAGWPMERFLPTEYADARCDGATP